MAKGCSGGRGVVGVGGWSDVGRCTFVLSFLMIFGCGDVGGVIDVAHDSVMGFVVIVVVGSYIAMVVGTWDGEAVGSRTVDNIANGVGWVGSVGNNFGAVSQFRSVSISGCGGVVVRNNRVVDGDTMAIEKVVTCPNIRCVGASSFGGGGRRELIARS